MGWGGHGEGERRIESDFHKEVVCDDDYAVGQAYARRDIWDLTWLRQWGAEVRPDLMKRKVADYRVEAYPALMDALIEKLPSIIGGKPFREEMKRLLPEDRYQRSLGNPRAERYLTATILELYRELKSGLP